MSDSKLLPLSIIIVAVCVLISSIWLGYSIQKSMNIQVQAADAGGHVMNLSQVAEYLGMTEEEVEAIIKIENKILEANGVFNGMMFPYFSIDGKRYFYREQIDEWLKEATLERKEYDTVYGFIF